MTSFKAPWWLNNPHLQTLWPVLLRPRIKNLPLTRERFELPDGDFVDLEWSGTDKNKPLILILHGLEGSIESHYAKGMVHALNREGWRCVFMHFRGCSGEPNRLPRNYHSGDTEDLNALVHALYRREPHLRMAAVGYSLGGNVLLKWLGETGKENPLHAAIAISVPFELQKTINRIRQGFSRLYEWHLLKCLCSRLSRKYQSVPAPIALPDWDSIQTLYEFDDKITAPLHGFKNADEYYFQCSSRQFLKNIEIPTLLVHAKDDPFMTEDIIPHQHELSQKVQLEVTDGGGHAGFVSGKFPWCAEYWLEKRTSQFLRQYF